MFLYLNSESPADSAAVFKMICVGAAKGTVGREPVGIHFLSVKESPKILPLVEAPIKDLIFGHKSVSVCVRGKYIFVFGVEKPRMANEGAILADVFLEKLPCHSV